MSATKPQNKAELKQYIKTALGEPVIQINVADEQIDLRIQEAIDLFTEYHYNGTEHVFVAHELTSVDNQNGYVTVPDEIHEVVRVLSFGGQKSGASSDLSFTYGPNMVNLNGASIAGGFGELNTGLLTLYLIDQNRSHYDAILNHEDSIRFNQHTRKIHFDMSKDKIRENDFVVYEAYVSVAETANTNFWNDNWLKRYATALVKLQWGLNLTKFVGAKLFGGDIEVNGDKILSDAQQEVADLKEELHRNYTAQPQIYIG